MDCCICQKRRLCSGADCYYDYYPLPLESQRELYEDQARRESMEMHDIYSAHN